MTAKRNISARIMRPSLDGGVRRERLFRLLERKHEKPVVWVSAPAGSGKTTMVSGYLESRNIPCIWYQCHEEDADLATFFYYMGQAVKTAAPGHRKPMPLLTPEYLGGVAVFTRRYFEELSRRLPERRVADGSFNRFVIVLDNYQDVPNDSPFHDMIAAAFASLPDSISFAVVSRTDPPPALVRFLANDRMGVLRYDDIRFTFAEARELMQRRGARLDMKKARAVYEKSEGWASGLTLLLEQARLKVVSAGSADGAIERVFDYFTAEIFARTAPDVQDFLLKTSFLPALNVSLCARLTGSGNAEQILADLNRNQFFTERLAGDGHDYRYHALFRAFLKNRALRVFDAAAVNALRGRAALLLEKSGRIEDAAHLYQRCGDMQNLGRLVTLHARLFLEQGRNHVIGEWIAVLPPELADDNAWLQYWAGMCSTPSDMQRARHHFEKAFALFRASDDAAGAYLSWAGIVDTFAFGLDEWKPLDAYIALLEGLRKAYPVFPSKEIDLIASSRMLFALTLRKTDRPQRVHVWLSRVTGLLQENPSFDIQMDTVFSMSVYYLWKGEYEKNAVLLDQAEDEIRRLKPSPFTVIRVKLMMGIQNWLVARYDDACRKLSEGLAVSAGSGVHVFDSLLCCFMATSEMARGNLPAAKNALSRQAAAATGSTLDAFFCRITAAWFELLTGQPSRAEEHLSFIAPGVAKMGNPYYKALWNVGMAVTMLQQGRIRDARTHINTSYRTGCTMKSHVVEWWSLLIEAVMLFREGRKARGLETLRRALEIGRRHRYVHLEFFLPQAMQLLCAEALEAGVETEYVRWLIGRLGLTPPAGADSVALCCEKWPYPIRIYTLGRFSIFRGDDPIEFSGKEQKKPIDLLKAIIACGGVDVPVEELTDMIWPESDGDLAQKSFETTLGRLRKLLGGEDLIKCRAGHVSLNPQRCWLDCASFDRLLDGLHETGTRQSTALAEKAIGLYKGPFLPSDSGYHRIVARREVMKSRLLRAVMKAASHYEQSGQWGKAADLFLKGIDTDYLAEEMYRHLMNCYRNLGNHADAVKTYNRCRSLLRAELGVEPSAKTRAVYASLLQE